MVFVNLLVCFVYCRRYKLSQICTGKAIGQIEKIEKHRTGRKYNIRLFLSIFQCFVNCRQYKLSNICTGKPIGQCYKKCSNLIKLLTVYKSLMDIEHLASQHIRIGFPFSNIFDMKPLNFPIQMCLGAGLPAQSEVYPPRVGRCSHECDKRQTNPKLFGKQTFLTKLPNGCLHCSVSTRRCVHCSIFIKSKNFTGPNVKSG